MSLLRRVIGGVLRRVRLRQRRTLREVAQAAGVSLPYLSEVERGRKEASSEILAAICRALGINLSDLLEEARDELRRVERRVPATSGAGLARLERVPVARREDTGPHLRIGFHADVDPRADVGTGHAVGNRSLPVAGAAGRIFHGVRSALGISGPVVSVGGPGAHVGLTVGGAGLRVRVFPS
ncbi:MAG: helix-turn-helix transcriptional regulator, partial [Micromonospora sp.]